MKLYYHKTDGGAEYLTNRYVKCPDGTREGTFKNARFVVRIDGDITKDAELMVRELDDSAEILKDILAKLPDLTEADTMKLHDALANPHTYAKG